MTPSSRNEIYERTMDMLKPVLERVATDPDYRQRLKLTPLQALAEMHVEIDAGTRQELEGRRFSEFWARRQQAAEGPVGVRDLPPEGMMAEGMTAEELEAVAGGVFPAPKPNAPILNRNLIGQFAPPYVPVGPASGDW